ncbi:hypothetical protein Dalu01_02334 [Deinococcus aluminii]|uniref:Uncharacterized protein n=2 Tax=Deinococcus aluminii TaxID=1656885 RepID=A0ABP9XEY3_9DEIO
MPDLSRNVTLNLYHAFMPLSDSAYVDWLIGERPYSEKAQCFMPDDELRPVPVQNVRTWIWHSPRRVVGKHMVSMPDYLSLLTLFIPFWEGEDPPLLYETILIRGTRGEIVARSATVEEARSTHAREMRQMYESVGLEPPAYPPRRPPSAET